MISKSNLNFSGTKTKTQGAISCLLKAIQNNLSWIGTNVAIIRFLSSHLVAHQNINVPKSKFKYNSFKYGDCLVTRILVAPSQIHHLWSDLEQQGSELETSLHIWICYKSISILSLIATGNCWYLGWSWFWNIKVIAKPNYFEIRAQEPLILCKVIFSSTI